MKKSTKKIIERWKKNVKKIKNTAERKALLFMVESMETKIERNRKELGEE